MTISVKHAFASAKADGTDSTLIQPSNWNAEHTISLAAGKVLGRDSSGNGAMQELPLSFDTSGNMSMSATGSFIPAVGTTGQRPASPTQGMVRFNTTSSKVELYNGTVWGSVGGGATISDTAPSSPSAGDLWWKSDEGQMYVYYTDANSSQWVVANAYAGGAAYLPLAGGQVTGNVGIGAGTGSGYRVAIAGSAASAVPLYLHSDATNAYVYSSSPLIVGSTGNYSTFLVANNGIKFVVGTLGQFGIGAANAIGTSGQVLTSGGSSAPPTWTSVGSAPTVLTYNSTPGTPWTKANDVPAGCTMAKIEVWGGGGGGGRSGSTAANYGGGGGAYDTITVPISTLGATETVTVGAGGLGATTTGNGGAGGTSSFGTSPYITVYGGQGGSNSTTGYYINLGLSTGTGSGGGGTLFSGKFNGIGMYWDGSANTPFLLPTTTFGGTGGGVAAVSGTNIVAGSSVYGGGGGGSSVQSSAYTGGLSVFGGAGGTSAATPGAGTQPGGGGSASTSANVTGAAGGAGRVKVTMW